MAVIGQILYYDNPKQLNVNVSHPIITGVQLSKGFYEKEKNKIRWLCYVGTTTK